MQIKIGNKIIDSEEESFMLILEPHEKNIIGNLGEDNRILLSPEGLAVTGMHVFYDWHEAFIDRYNKTPVAHANTGWCSGCKDIDTCNIDWIKCTGNKSIKKEKKNEK